MLFCGIHTFAAPALEAKAYAQLRLERNSEWFGEAGGAEEIDWFAEVRLTRHVLELVSIVSGVENIERLEEEAELFILAPLEELRNAHVQL